MLRRMMLRDHIKKLDTDKSGAALLEVSVVLPVVLSISLGVIEFGNAIYSQHLIFNGVRDAARYVAGLPQANSAGASLVAANNIAAQNIAVWGTNAPSPVDTCNNSSTTAMKNTRRVSWWCDRSTVAISYTPTVNDNGLGTKLYRGGATIQTVTLTATVPYKTLGFLSYFGLSTPTLIVSHTERLYGVR